MGQIENQYLNAVQKCFQKYSSSVCHGLSNDDFSDFKRLLETAKSNDTEHKTVFPDFISDNGFIEHFAISSGELFSNGGYKVNADKNRLIKRQEQFMQNVTDYADQTGEFVVASKTHAFERWHESLESFEDVFKSHWESHIKSLNEYNGNKHISCFMITSDDIIMVHEHADNNGLWYGDLVSERRRFCLAYDICLLDFMYQYVNKVDYVIYFNQFGYMEVIKVNNIPALKEFLHCHKYSLAACNGIQSAHTFGVVCPNTNKGDKNNG